MNLKYLTDKQLLIDTKTLVKEERKATAALLHYLKEIETRKLYSELRYPSLFKYLTDELGYSAAAAMRRIEASKLLSEIPEIHGKIESGSISLSNIAKAADKFKINGIQDKKFKKEILIAIENTSARTCDKILNEIVVPGKINIPTPPPTYNIIFNKENFKKFCYIRDLLAHQKLNRDRIIGKILDEAVSAFEKKRFNTETRAPEKSSKSRYVPTGLKKVIFKRDKKCTICGSTYALEIDHIKPYAIGGVTEKKNLRLLCRNCNQRERISSNLHLPNK
jgi:hypothetical protein